MTSKELRARNWGKEPRVHGVNGYDNWGCRCEVCAQASRERRRVTLAKRRANRQAIPEDIHGKYTTYSNWACRCGPCREDWARYRQAYRAEKRKR